LVTGCSGGVLDPAGPVSRAQVTILLDALTIMLAIIIPTIIATLTFAWWYRASNKRARDLPNWAYSGRLELIVWSIPTLVVFFLGGIAWTGSHLLDPARPLATPGQPLEINVVALDWKWLFIYPKQGVASVNRLVVPAGVPLKMSLTSASVLNVFFVPRLGSMVYTMFGMRTLLNLQADEPGVYFGRAAHFNGDGFPEMHFEVHALPPSDFDDWARGVQAAGPALDAASYRALLKQTTNVQPYTYSSVQSGLFEAILRQQLPPGAGPTTGPPAPAGKPTREN
jgi:cytochrome o ubiquinol oxidase subunit 2